jgi:hypothetical protein
MFLSKQLKLTGWREFREEDSSTVDTENIKGGKFVIIMHLNYAGYLQSQLLSQPM